MLRSKIILLWTALACVMGLLLNSAGCVGASSGTSPNSNPPDPTSPKIQHVVVIFQETRTPDNLFHGLPGADIANGGFNSKGKYIPLTRVSLHAWYDLDHSHGAFLTMYDDGKMDGADKIGMRCGMPQGCPATPIQVCQPFRCRTLLQIGRDVHVCRSHVPDESGA